MPAEIENRYSPEIEKHLAAMKEGAADGEQYNYNTLYKANELAFDHEVERISANDEKIDRAISVGLFLRGFEGAWLDDNIYALRPTEVERVKYKYLFGWDPKSDIATREHLGTIQALYATGFDMEYVSKETFVRKILDVAVTDFGLSHKDVYQGLRTGDFGSKTSLLKHAFGVVTKKIGGRQEEYYNIIFGSDSAVRKKFYDEYMKVLGDSQSEMEVFAGLRDNAIDKKHSENGGHYQKIEVEPGLSINAPVGWRQARDYILGDQKKMLQNKRLSGHFHEWALGIQQEQKDALGRVIGQGIYEIDDEAYQNLHGDVNNYKTWEDNSPSRNKTILRGLMADEKEDEYTKDGWFTIGEYMNQVGKYSEMYLMYQHMHPEAFYGKSVEQREQTAVNFLVQKNYAKQLKYSPKEFLFAMASATKVPFQQMEGDGTINLRLAGHGEYRTINELIKAVNDGQFGFMPDTPIGLLTFAKLTTGASVEQQRQNEDSVTDT